ncbi:MAG: hypothetical protein QOJ33_2340 [Chloroflexota bacterium]|nr:hypothetical protein [Chloroflexota bacterium]MEA2669406.1 hypothetical protein [Chloroflexota bacterium]
MGGGHADPGDTAACQRPTRHGHLVGEDPGGADNLSTIEDRQRSVELERLFGDGELLVGGERSAKGPAQQGAIRALFLGPDRPELEACRYAYRWTSARARQGLPDPFTSFSGATTNTAPVGGSVARLASCVRPYLLAPSRNW